MPSSPYTKAKIKPYDTVYGGKGRTAVVNRGPQRNEKGQLKSQTNQTLRDLRINDDRNGRLDTQKKFNNKTYKQVRGDFKNSAELRAAKISQKGRGRVDYDENRSHSARAAALRAAFNVG